MEISVLISIDLLLILLQILLQMILLEIIIVVLFLVCYHHYIKLVTIKSEIVLVIIFQEKNY